MDRRVQRAATGRWLLIAIAGLVILAWSITRDIGYTRAYPGDLRNRVVGARLVKDGRLPYFYKWAPRDGLRYYDPENCDSFRVSNITSSPFFHHLLSPVADLPESTLNYGWLISEYLILSFMTVRCFFWARTTEQKQTVLVISLLFLLTNAWKAHTALGQTYLWVPAFAMLFFVCVRKPGHFARGFAAGAIAGSFILVRINAIFFFLPFLFLVSRYTRWWRIAFCLPLLLLAGWILADRHERALWQDYDALLKESLKVHQNLGPTIQHNPPDPPIAQWEGIDRPAADKLSDAIQGSFHSENGNVFVLVRLVFHRSLPPVVWQIVSVLLIIAFGGCFYFLHRPFATVSVWQVAIVAFCLYMISDLFSPYYRHQYYTVQWLFPLLLAAACWEYRYRKAIRLLVACLLLSIIHLPFLKMQNTIAEYALMATLLGFSLFTGAKKPSKTAPASAPLSA